MTAVTRISRWEVKRGRQDELEKTGTGEATIFVNDVEGLYDPSNAGSPYYAGLDGAQVAITLRNPVTNTYHVRFRGSIEEYGYDLHESQRKNEVAINCVDLFDYLANAEMVPGQHGVPAVAPAGVEAGSVFYDNAEVDARIRAVLDDAGIPPELTQIFSGNVYVQETIYDAGYSFLAGIQDAADAEFPGVANAYMDAEGKVVFHGRHARFDPDGVVATTGGAWNFRRWKVGDAAAMAADSAYAQLRPPLASDRSIKMVINSALITPLGILEADVNGQYNTDPASIARYGTRSYTAQDIRTLRHKTNGNTANDETYLMGYYYISNYNEPRTRPRQITVRSLPPTDSRAAATWALICGVEISDIVHLKCSIPGGGSFDEDFYVEGITTACEPSSAGYDIVEVVLDVSPAAYYPIGSIF